MKDLAKILLYFVAVIFFGALLAPPLYWGGQALASHGVLKFLGQTEFQKFFNRAVLVAAVVLLVPTVRSFRIDGVRDLGIVPNPQWKRHCLIGFALAAVLVGVMATTYIGLDIYRWKTKLPWDALPKLALSAVVVSLLEETLFRGAILGIFLKSMRPYAALFWVTTIFAALHFIKPDDEFSLPAVNWLSGFALLPHSFHQFSEPQTLLAGFSTLFVLGWILGYGTLKTRSLWLSIGFHAGVVFVKMAFSKFTKRDAAFLPWVGEELQIGLVPVLVLSLGGLVLWFWLTRPKAPAAANP